MGHILQHAAEYETVHRLSKMLQSVTEEYKATESYALFSTIVCWVIQRARTPAHQNDHADIQAREVGKALQDSRISDEPWSITNFPDMTAFEFFKSMRDAVAHGDGRQIRPWNETDSLIGQIIPIAGNDVWLRRADMRRLGCALAEVFCDTMQKHEPEGNLLEAVQRIAQDEEVV